MNLQTKFNIDSNVTIIPLNIPGQVTEIRFCRRVSYQVCYYWNSEQKIVNFWEDELKLKE